MALGKGLYEILITEALDLQLREVGEAYVVEREGLNSAEAADRIALHMSRVIRRAIADLDDDVRAKVGIDLARRLVSLVVKGPDSAHALPIKEAALLRAVVGRLPDGSAERVAAPLTPLLDTALMTNSPGEPRRTPRYAGPAESASRRLVPWQHRIRPAKRPKGFAQKY